MCVCVFFLFFYKTVYLNSAYSYCTSCMGFYFLWHTTKSTMFLMIVGCPSMVFLPTPAKFPKNPKKMWQTLGFLLRRILQRYTPLAGTTPAGCTTPRGWTLAEGACLVCSQGLGAKLNKKSHSEWVNVLNYPMYLYKYIVHYSTLMSIYICLTTINLCRTVLSPESWMTDDRWRLIGVFNC